MIISNGYYFDVHMFYVSVKYAIATDCCVGNTPNRVNPQCLAIPVPEDDPYLRLTNIRCLNLTRVSTFQDMGCLPRTLPLERVSIIFYLNFRMLLVLRF